MLMQPLTQLIEAYTGLRLRSLQTVALRRNMQSRLTALKLTTPEQYYQYLTHSLHADTLPFTPASPEWQQIIQLVMAGESYFFRDQGQFQLLRQQILPALIRDRLQHAAIHQTKPSLRLWSAGCSTGEEAYSLAILVQQLIPDWAEWDLLILGTDINAYAIAHAQRGLYSAWSFRTTETAVQATYFQANQGQWQLNAKSCCMVTFRPGNLVQDFFPAVQTDLWEMDLIVCRNVFIYFAPATIATVVAKFSQTLRPGGYLMTGHTELHGQTLAALNAQLFPESLVYRRSPVLPHAPLAQTMREAAQDSTAAQPSSSPTAVPVEPNDGTLRQAADSPTKQLAQATSYSERQTLESIEQCLQQGDATGAIAIAQAAIAQTPQSFELHHLMAKSYITLEAYEPAKHHAQQMAAIDALSTVAYYLLAYIARQQEEWTQAKALMKRIIYLDAAAIAAYLELSHLYAQEGNAIRAEKMQTTAMALMEQGTGNRE